MFENVDRRTDAGVTGILLALMSLGSGELKKSKFKHVSLQRSTFLLN